MNDIILAIVSVVVALALPMSAAVFNVDPDKTLGRVILSVSVGAMILFVLFMVRGILLPVLNNAGT